VQPLTANRPRGLSQLHPIRPLGLAKQRAFLGRGKEKAIHECKGNRCLIHPFGLFLELQASNAQNGAKQAAVCAVDQYLYTILGAVLPNPECEEDTLRADMGPTVRWWYLRRLTRGRHDARMPFASRTRCNHNRSHSDGQVGIMCQMRREHGGRSGQVRSGQVGR
jgi:hypothetical protein